MLDKLKDLSIQSYNWQRKKHRYFLDLNKLKTVHPDGITNKHYKLSSIKRLNQSIMLNKIKKFKFVKKFCISH